MTSAAATTLGESFKLWFPFDWAVGEWPPVRAAPFPPKRRAAIAYDNGPVQFFVASAVPLIAAVVANAAQHNGSESMETIVLARGAGRRAWLTVHQEKN